MKARGQLLVSPAIVSTRLSSPLAALQAASKLVLTDRLAPPPCPFSTIDGRRRAACSGSTIMPFALLLQRSSPQDDCTGESRRAPYLFHWTGWTDLAWPDSLRPGHCPRHPCMDRRTERPPRLVLRVTRCYWAKEGPAHLCRTDGLGHSCVPGESTARKRDVPVSPSVGFSRTERAPESGAFPM